MAGHGVSTHTHSHESKHSRRSRGEDGKKLKLLCGKIHFHRSAGVGGLELREATRKAFLNSP